MFVVTLPATERDPESYASRAQAAGADMLEVRGDLSPDLQPFSCSLPILATPRGMDADWIARLRPKYVDLDLDESVELPVDAKIIRSHHDYQSTPDCVALDLLADRLRSSGASLIKLATTICDYEDIAGLERLRSRLPVGSILLGMGEKAHVQRLRSVAYNSWTYACLDSAETSAPGQLDLATHTLFDSTDNAGVYGVLGGQGLKSRGPMTHGRWFRDHEFDAVYAQFPSTDFEADFKQLAAQGVEGFSVTSPHKVAAFQIADAHGPLVRELGAANTLIKEGSKWIAHMTDVEGFVRAYPVLRSLKSVRILGAGGVASAVIYACRELGIETIEVWARREEQAEELGQRFGISVSKNADQDAVNAVISTVPTDADLPFPEAKHGGIAIDLRYGAETPFLRRAADLGYTTLDGSAMFEYQARAQFRLFTGIEIHGEQ